MLSTVQISNRKAIDYLNEQENINFKAIRLILKANNIVKFSDGKIINRMA